MIVIVLLISILGLTWESARLLKIRVSLAYAWVMASTSVLLYCGLITHLLLPLTWILLLAGNFLFLKLCCVCAGKRVLRQRLRVFIPATLVFVIMFGILWSRYGYLSGPVFSGWDEFSFWGLAIRSLAIKPWVTEVLGGFYPPMAAMFPYYVCRIVGFSEAHAYFGHTLLLICGILAIADVCNWRTLWVSVPAAIGCFFIFYFFGFSMQSLYVDGLLAVYFAVSLLCVRWGFKQRPWHLQAFITCPFVVFLAMIKPQGFVLSLAVFMLWSMDLVLGAIRDRFSLSPRFLTGKIIQSNAFKAMVLTGIMIIAAQISWMVAGPRSERIQHPYSLDAGARTARVLSVVEARIATKGFVNVDGGHLNVYLRKLGLTSNDRWELIKIELSFWNVLVLANALLLCIIAIYGVRRSGAHSGHLLFSLLMGLPAYLLLLCLTFVFVFDEQQGLGAQGLERYLAIYVCAWVLVCFGILQRCISRSKLGLRQAFGVSLFGASLMFSLYGGNWLSWAWIHGEMPKVESKRVEETKRIDSIVASLGSQAAKVFLICQGLDNFPYYVARYQFAPIQTNSLDKENEGSWCIAKRTPPKANSVLWLVTPEQFVSYIRRHRFTHIFVNKADQTFWKDYRELFSPEEVGSLPETGLLYEIQPVGITPVFKGIK